MKYNWQKVEDAPTDNRIVVVQVKGRLGVFTATATATPSGLRCSGSNLSIVAWADLIRKPAPNNSVGDNTVEGTYEADFQAFDQLPERIKTLLLYSPEVCSAVDALRIVKQYGEVVTYNYLVKTFRSQDVEFLSHLDYDGTVQYTKLRRHLALRVE